jgi:hypothetical protein
VFRKEGQEVLIPTPGAMPHSVDKKQWCFMSLGHGLAGDGFDSHADSSDDFFTSPL